MAHRAPAHPHKKDLVKVYRQALTDGVSLERVEQKIEKLAARFLVADAQEAAEVRRQDKEFRSAIPKVVRLGAAILPAVLLLLGAVLVGSATFPILAYYVGDFSENMVSLKAPIPPDQLLDVTPLVLANSTLSDDDAVGTLIADSNEPVILTTALDYTDLSNWFTDAELPEFSTQQASATYTLDIPKVNVKNAEVQIGGTDLNHSLIQYPGTALPGQAGSPVIFGHSVLRQFYNPSENNSRRYNSIFSYIMTLEPGDKIYLTQDNVRYTYVVQSKTEVKPTDTYILSQRYDTRQLKLVTCVPEGTYLRRGVITAQLVKE